MAPTEPDPSTEPDPPTESVPSAESIPSTESVPSAGSVLDRRRFLTRRRLVVGVAVLSVVATTLLGLDAVRSARRMLNGITDARASLDAGAESVVVGDPDASIPQFHAAATSADAAVASSNRPAMRILGLLPVIGPNVRATRAVATAESAVAATGLTMAEAAKLLGWNDILIPAAASTGSVNLTKIQAATPKVDAVARQLGAALTALQAAGGGHLVGTVASGYDDVLVALQRRAVLAEDLRTVFHLVPSLLGGQGPRRYLVALQSLGKPRATGGEIEAEAVLTAHDGTLELGRMSPASSDLAAANASPDLPTDAPAILLAARHDGLGSLDGVILTDSVGLQDMLWMTGSVSSSALHNPVTMDTGVEVLERRLFIGTDQNVAAAAQAKVAVDIIRGFLGKRPSVEAFAIGMAQAISQRHLEIWSASTDDQRSLTTLGATGSFNTKTGALAVVWRGTAANRAVSFVRRSTAQIVKLDAGGLAKVKTKVMLVNHAPKGPRSLLLGLRGPVGAWSADATVYLPRTAANPSATTAAGTPTTIGQDLETTTATGTLSGSPGHVASMTVSYRQRKAAVQQGSVWRYQLVIAPQPALAPMAVHVSITPPDGATVVSKANELLLNGGALTYDGSPVAPLTLWVVYR